MGSKKKRNRKAGRMAMGQRQELLDAQATAQAQYDADYGRLRDASDVTDFYADLQAAQIDPLDMQLAQTQQAQIGNLGPAGSYQAQGYDAEGYDAMTTNVAGLARGADTGLSNVFNNLQVSTAGAELEAQEADQALAASQDMMMQMGGGGGATALAQQAARSKAGIRADIDKQVKANEMARATGEQALQRDLLAQGNLASQFDLGQQQFNAGAVNQARQFTAQQRNQAAQFGAAAQNQAAQFNVGQANNFALQRFGAENQMNQFNAQASNNAFAQQANAVNNAIARNADLQAQFDMNKAAGQSQAQSNQYDALMGIFEIATNQLNEADRELGANTAVIQQAAMSGGLFGNTKDFKREAYRNKGGGTLFGGGKGAMQGNATSIYGPSTGIGGGP